MFKESSFFGKIFPKKTENSSKETGVQEEIVLEDQKNVSTKNQALVEKETSEENLAPGPLEGLSLEERFNVLVDKKSEIDSLEERRREFYIDAKNLEDKMIVMGITDEQKKEIRSQIVAQGGEISEQISQIKKDYGIEATPVEVLSLRYKMLEAEVDRVQKALESNRRELKPQVYGLLLNIQAGHNSQLRYQELLNILHIDKYSKISEVADFLNDANTDYREEIPKIKKLIEDLSSNIEKGTIYKTDGEIEAAEIRLNRIKKLWGKTDSDLQEAKNKSGRFAERK